MRMRMRMRMRKRKRSSDDGTRQTREKEEANQIHYN
jgi:hypothetical protein